MAAFLITMTLLNSWQDSHKMVFLTLLVGINEKSPFHQYLVSYHRSEHSFVKTIYRFFFWLNRVLMSPMQLLSAYFWLRVWLNSFRIIQQEIYSASWPNPKKSMSHIKTLWEFSHVQQVKIMRTKYPWENWFWSKFGWDNCTDFY